MVGARPLDHPRAHIDAHAARWPQRGEKIARAAAQLEDRAARRDDRLQPCLDLGVVVRVAAVPLVAGLREPVVVLPDLVLFRVEDRAGDDPELQGPTPCAAFAGTGVLTPNAN